MPTFKSVAEIEKHYAEAIKQAGSKFELVNQLQIDKDAVLASFRLEQVAARERKVWMRDALHDYPLAAEFPDLVSGDNEEALRKSAQTLHEKLEKVADSYQRQKRINDLVAAQLAAAENASQETPDGEPVHQS